jgi:hypothetical protein
VGAGARGVFYVDVYGNRELVHETRDQCMDPIPLQPRPPPPAVPQATRPSAADPKSGARASVLLLNVYEGDFDWPADTKIERLRVVQVLPKTSAHATIPQIGDGSHLQFARFPLGTVPVMEDGSAWFEAPVGREIYFQALDGQGRAVQSMRSGTYVHPGERLVCAGCHEDKQKARKHGQGTALALRQAPGGKPWPIEPDVTDAEGNLEVLTFARHIQPILDRRCAGCHQKPEHKRAPALHDRTVDPKTGWTESYRLLVRRTFNYRGKGQDFTRTTPGRFGALASPLTRHFSPAHHDVQLAPAEWRTVVAWLDCLAPFYGWDWDLESQQRGEKLVPRIDFDPSNPLARDRPESEASVLSSRWTAEIRALQGGRQ